MSSSSEKSRLSTTLLSGASVAALFLVWIIPMGMAWKLAPDLGHSWVVPVLMAYLWWERWDERPQEMERPRLGLQWWLLAFALMLGHLPLRLLLTLYPVMPSLLAGYGFLMAAILIIAAFLIAGRPGVKWVAPPLVLAVSMLPIPAVIEEFVLFPIRCFIASFVAELNNLIGQPAIALGTTVRLADVWLGIEEACGGIRSLQACIMVSLFFGEWFRFSLSRRLWLLCLGIVAAFGGNLARVLFLSLRTSSDASSLGPVHDPAGWAAMLASLALTGWIACHWNAYRLPEQRISARTPLAGSSRAWTWVGLVAAALLVNEAGTRLWYSRPSPAHADVPHWTLRFPDKNKSFRPLPLEDFARETLRPDFFAAGEWRAGPNLIVSAYYIEWKQGQAARIAPFAHNPTVCLPMSGCMLAETYAPLTIRWQGGEIPFQLFRFTRLSEELLVAYTVWNPVEGKVLEPTLDYSSRLAWMQSLWTEVKHARQDQPAQMLSVTIPMQTDGVKKMERLITEMIQPLPQMK